MTDLIAALQQQREESNSSLFENRDQARRNLEYYSLGMFGNERDGRSKYVSPDVFDTVESLKTVFSEVFLSSRNVVKFIADGTTSVEETLSKTAYCNREFRRAGKAKMFKALWHDAALQKRGSLLVEDVPDPQHGTIPLMGADINVVNAQLSQIPGLTKIDDSNVEMQEVTAIDPRTLDAVRQTRMTGELGITIDMRKWQFTVMKPERHLRDPKCDSGEDAMWEIYVDEIPRGTLIRMGYNREQLNSIKAEYQWNQNEVDQSRKSFDRSNHSLQHNQRIDDQENLTTFKTWTWINLFEYGYEEYPDEIRLYEIFWAEDEILTYEPTNDEERENPRKCIREIDEKPVFDWSFLRIPHADSDMAPADIVAHTQKANSSLKRGILNYQDIVNNPRFEAEFKAFLNPNDLVDNPIGGVMWTKKPGQAAHRLDQPEMSPMVFETINMLDRDKENRSGMSDLAKGMNTDALRYQNADNMVERLTNASRSRVMEQARDFAETFLIPLCKHIVKRAMEWDTSQTVMESGGRQIMIAPSQWQSDATDMEVHVALTAQQREEFAANLLSMHNLQTNDPQLSQLYGLQQRHALMDDVYEALGIADSTRYMQRPDSPEFMQQVQQQQALEQQQAQALEATQQRIMSIEEDKNAYNWAKIRDEALDKMEDNQREDEKLRIDTEFREREISLKEAQPAA